MFMWLKRHTHIYNTHQYIYAMIYLWDISRVTAFTDIFTMQI